MLSVSDKYDSVNERTQEISELTKITYLRAWQNARKFITQLAYGDEAKPFVIELNCESEMLTGSYLL